MKNVLNRKGLPLITVVLGAAAFVLRWLLYALAVDEKNLLPLGHPLEILLWLVTIGAAALIVAAVWKQSGSNRYMDNFGPSLTAAVGHFAAAAGILLTVLFSQPETFGTIAAVWKVLGILSAPALVLAGFSRLKGRRPMFLTHMVVCVFLMFHMLGNCQTWSGNPQLQDYVFSLFGCVTLMLFAYYETAFDVDAGKRRMQLAMGLLNVFFSCAALSGTEYPLLYLGGAVWALTDLFSLKPVPAGPRENPAPESE